MADEQGKGFFDGNPKTMFAFGVVSGLAVALIFGNLTGVAYGARGDNSGWFGNGAANTNTNTNTGTGNTATNPTPVAAGKIPDVTSSDKVRGDLKKAKVVVVEYSDYECPFCGRHHPTMKQLFEKYGDKIAWVYRHFPLSFHPEANPAALAAECANEQGKFWDYTDTLFDNQDKLGESYYKQLAADMGMKTSQFDDCFDTAKYQEVIDKDAAGGRAAGVSGTPATFINGQLVASSNGSSVGAAPLATFTAIVDQALK